MSQPVIFLDVDGPLIPTRAVFLPKQTLLQTQFDPIAVAMVNRLAHDSEALIVISSIWRFKGKERITELFCEQGLSLNFHDDWCTDLSGKDRRHIEINEWLSRHPEVICHLAIDDELILDPAIKSIKVCTRNGISFENYIEAERLLCDQ